jgi:hypothetical protein
MLTMILRKTDFSPDCILEILDDRYAGRVSEIVKHRYQVIKSVRFAPKELPRKLPPFLKPKKLISDNPFANSVWKPLVGPLRD